MKNTPANLQYTPGPWYVTPARRYEQDNACDVLPVGEYRGSVCYIQSCEHIDGISRAESAGNARLIACAPEMLEVLRDIAMPAATLEFKQTCRLTDDMRLRVEALLARVIAT